MAAHPLGVIVAGLSCLGVGAVVMTAVGPGMVSEAPVEKEETAEPEIVTIEDRYKQLDEQRLKCATGEGEACFELASAYETREDLWGQKVRGDGVKRDDRKAAGYFRMSCNAGYREGCRGLGRMYEFGKGVEQNSAEAARYYHKACGLRDGGQCEGLAAGGAAAH